MRTVCMSQRAQLKLVCVCVCSGDILSGRSQMTQAGRQTKWGEQAGIGAKAGCEGRIEAVVAAFYVPAPPPLPAARRPDAPTALAQGTQCQFAHGPTELKPLPAAPDLLRRSACVGRGGRQVLRTGEGCLWPRWARAVGGVVECNSRK